MLPSTFWQKEILEDLKVSRALIARFLLPLILISPLALPWVPDRLRAGGVALAVLFTGTFGSAVGLVKLKDSRMAERLSVLPLPPAGIAADYILANAFLDGLQLTVPLALVLITKGFLTPWIVWAAVCFILSLVAANALGMIVAAMAGSSGEVHLYAFLAVAVIGGLSGLFYQGPAGIVGQVLPFRYLSDALLATWGGPEPQMPALALASAALFFTVALSLAGRMFRSL